MKLSKMKTAVTRGVGGKVLAAKRNSPHIFFALGVAGVVGSTYLACKATLQLSDTLDEVQADIEKVRSTKRDADETQSDLYPDDNYQRDLVLVHVKGGAKVAKLYAPSIVVGAAAIGSLTGSHVQLARRNSALAAAAAAITKALNDYRERVRDHLGEAKERDLYLGAKVESVKDPETGKSKQIVSIDADKSTSFGKWFDAASPYWEKDSELNRIRVQCNQSYANQLLQARGYLFLNEVYEMFGIERTQIGNVVGWLSTGDGDGYVDFGTFEAHDINLMQHREPNIWLDFNVDGPILHTLDKQ
jgi:hypothetical protein